MESVKQLTNSEEVIAELNEIHNIAKSIINKSFPLMKELKKESMDLIDDLMDEIDNISEPQAVEYLKIIFMKLTKDADHIYDEIDHFKECVLLGEEGLEEGENDIPFMLKVWYGDMYDNRSELDGLRALKEDLKMQLTNINDEYIIKRAKELYIKNL